MAVVCLEFGSLHLWNEVCVCSWLDWAHFSVVVIIPVAVAYVIKVLALFSVIVVSVIFTIRSKVGVGVVVVILVCVTFWVIFKPVVRNW